MENETTQQEVPTTPVDPPKKSYPVALLLLLPIIAVISVYFLFRPNKPDISPDAVRPTQTQIPVPSIQNPGRRISHVATQSAYLKLEQRVVDLASQISTTATLDVRTAPPSLILPLGFK